MNSIETKSLRKAARLWGLQPTYKNANQTFTTTSNDTLLRVLSDLSSCKINSNQDLQHLIQRRHQQKSNQGLEPVLVQWENEPAKIFFYLTPKEVSNKITIQIRNQDLKDKNEFGFDWQPEELKNGKCLLPFSLKIAPGYYEFRARTAERTLSALLIVAPKKLQDIPEYKKSWGAFLPLYSVRSQKDWGLGSFQEMHLAAKHLKNFGAKWIGSLPLLANDFDSSKCDPSPYSALSRLFWNEIHLDVDTLVAESKCEKAKQELQNPEFQNQLDKLRNSKMVEYHQVYEHKKKILTLLSRHFFATAQDRTEDYQEFLRLFPDLSEYVHFRSQDPEQQNFHRYVQYQMHQSLLQWKNKGELGLYMDFPVGVNDSGFDFAKYKEIFFSQVSVGAPPEPVFQQGQDWGFPSFHPDNLRQSGYAYLRKSLENHLRYTRILRLDHVMGLFRAYIIPKKSSAKDGVYLRFPPQELFAIACLEAHRAQADLIGENLGTVPDAVNSIMHKRNFKGMTVGQLNYESTPKDFFSSISEKTLLCLNTHDMAQFASFVTGDDLDLVARLGILDQKYLTEFKAARRKATQRWAEYSSTQPGDGMKIFRSILEGMSKSDAYYMIVNPEDLWGETQPQNIPGTYQDNPNWRKKFRLRIEDWSKDSECIQGLEILAKYRTQKQNK